MKKVKLTKALQRCFLLTIFFLASVVQNVQAQSKNVKGNVKDASGEVLPGASIIVVGTSVGTMTDFDGNFEVRVGADAKSISVSSLGYKTQEIAFTGQEVINVILEEESNKLEEVVVVGYGTQKAKDVTGAISKIKAADIERTNNVTVEQALTGRIAGVNTTSSDGSLGAGINIRIRGGTSINANNEPLYVIDGLPIEVNYDIDNISSAVDTPPTSPLANLDPGSIKSIEVLKDASAAAIYGARGANGVVIITTKTGKAGKAKLTFNTSTALSIVPRSRFVDVMNTSEYGRFQIYRTTSNNGNYNPDATFSATEDGVAYNGLTAAERAAYYDRDKNTNWQEKLFRMGVVKNYALGASGGTEGNLYSLRASYLNNEGTVRNSYFNRYNVTFNFQNKLTDKLKVVSSLAPSFSVKRGPTSGGGFNQRNLGSVIRSLSRQPDRGVGDVFEEDSQSDPGVWLDPVTQAERTQTFSTVYGFNGNSKFIYEFSKGFTANVRLGLNYNSGVTKAFFSREFGRGQQQGGLGTRFHYISSSLNAQYMLNYRKTFNKHSITLLGGFTQTDVTRDSEYIQTTNFEVESTEYNGLQNGLDPLAPQTILLQKTMKSYLARANYGYGGKYNLTVSMRADGTSVFINNKWGYFPAAALGWNAHKEQFLKNSEAISNLKMRFSYGQTGNAGVPFYGAFGLLETQNYTLGNTTNAGLSSASVTNPDLKWEFTDQFDGGIDLGLFDNRISLTADAYYKKTTDLLLRMPLPVSSGFETWLTNVGSVENKGLELALSTINFDGTFKWSSEFNFSLNRNKVLDLGGAPEQTFDDQFTNGQSTGILRVGESLGNWIGYETAGVFTLEDFEGDDYVSNPVLKQEVLENYVGTNATPTYGDLKFVNQKTVPIYDDQNNIIGYEADNILSDDDRKIIARTQPKHFGSMFNKFSYKGLELGVFFTYKYGFDVINGNKHRMSMDPGPNWNKTADRNDSWTHENPTGVYPRPDYQYQKFTDLSVEDGSFVRLQSVNLSYRIPTKTAKKLGFSSLKFFTNADNVFIWTDYTGYDPEVSVARGQRAITSAGLDYGAYPRTLNISLGLNVGF
ncbi:MAG: SusC/RagA family TonB-linked outer membrane protein [Flavicella sp.]